MIRFEHTHNIINFKIGKFPGIYVIYNKNNSKIYVGRSINVDARIKKHFYELRKGRHCNDHLQNAFNKYGEMSFSVAVVKKCPVDNLVVVEQMWIDKTNCIKDGYNISPKSDGSYISEETKEKMRNRIVSEETKNKLRDSATVRMSIPENNPMYGRNHSESAKEKMRASAIERNYSGSNNPFYGRCHTDETKHIISEANKGNNTKLNLDMVHSIKEMIVSGHTNEEIAAIFGVSKHYIRKIRYGEVYREDGDKLNSGKSKKLSWEQVCEIRKMISEGIDDLKIANMFCVRRSTIYSIKNNRIWKTEN